MRWIGALLLLSLIAFSALTVQPGAEPSSENTVPEPDLPSLTYAPLPHVYKAQGRAVYFDVSPAGDGLVLVRYDSNDTWSGYVVEKLDWNLSVTWRVATENDTILRNLFIDNSLNGVPAIILHLELGEWEYVEVINLRDGSVLALANLSEFIGEDARYVISSYYYELRDLLVMKSTSSDHSLFAVNLSGMTLQWVITRDYDIPLYYHTDMPVGVWDGKLAFLLRDYRDHSTRCNTIDLLIVEPSSGEILDNRTIELDNCDRYRVFISPVSPVLLVFYGKTGRDRLTLAYYNYTVDQLLVMEDLPEESVEAVVWSPSGRHVAIYGEAGRDNYTLAIAEVFGGVLYRVYDDSDFTVDMDYHSWSPDGSEYLFTVMSGLRDELYIVNVEKRSVVFETSKYGITPYAWDAESNMLFIVRTVYGEYNIIEIYNRTNYQLIGNITYNYGNYLSMLLPARHRATQYFYLLERSYARTYVPGDTLIFAVQQAEPVLHYKYSAGDGRQYRIYTIGPAPTENMSGTATYTGPGYELNLTYNIRVTIGQMLFYTYSDEWTYKERYAALFIINATLKSNVSFGEIDHIWINITCNQCTWDIYGRSPYKFIVVPNVFERYRASDNGISLLMIGEHFNDTNTVELRPHVYYLVLEDYLTESQIHQILNNLAVEINAIKQTSQPQEDETTTTNETSPSTTSTSHQTTTDTTKQGDTGTERAGEATPQEESRGRGKIWLVIPALVLLAAAGIVFFLRK